MDEDVLLALRTAMKNKRVTYLADGQDVVNVQELEERPHREVRVDKVTANVDAAEEVIGNLEARLCTRRRHRRGIEPDELAGAGCGARENLGDLECVRLHVLEEPCTLQPQGVPHQVVNWGP